MRAVDGSRRPALDDRPDEPLSLAVGLRPIGPAAGRSRPASRSASANGWACRPHRVAVDPLDLDPAALVRRRHPGQDPTVVAAFSSARNLGPAVAIDSGEHGFPAGRSARGPSTSDGPGGICGSATADAMPGATGDLAELLGVDVDHPARPLELKRPGRLRSPSRLSTRRDG